ncbi:MAG: ABC transporter ATP-binding protein [Clostridiales bacterium]|nr:ABC transporter ATP-binding protein [Clostridiales bacterium]
MKTNILEVRDLCVAVGDKQILNHLNLEIPDGEVHALFGQNGSGKTTLMMTIMGFSGYDVTNGQILFKGRNIAELDVSERARLGMSIAQQRPPTVFGVKLRTILDYILRDTENPQERMTELAASAKMEDFLSRSINEGLSGGEIKRAELLQLIAMRPDFAMMDEPDSGIDIEALNVIGGLINQLFSPDETHPVKRKTGLIITHNGNILRQLHIDKGHVMHNGSIGCSGNPDIILDKVSRVGYEECVHCIETRCE